MANEGFWALRAHGDQAISDRRYLVCMASGDRKRRKAMPSGVVSAGTRSKAPQPWEALHNVWLRPPEKNETKKHLSSSEIDSL